MIADIEIHRAAEELVERHGDNALAVAHEHVAALAAANDQAGMNGALRVVSALEVMAASKQP
jgi:hypothetical protein